MNLYEHTWLYDLVHEKPADSEQIAFYERCIKRYGSPVLELACGTGNYLVTLSHSDVEISGLDISPEMLHVAEERASKHSVETNLYNGDMRSFDLDDKFRLIFIAGNSLQHLLTHEDIESTFDSVKRHLQPDGRFIVEVFNPSLKLLARNPNHRYLVGEYQTEIGFVVVTENTQYDSATQVNRIDWHYRIQNANEERTVSFMMRQFFPQELDSLFHYNGFRIERKFGDFDESDFSSSSLKQIIIAALA